MVTLSVSGGLRWDKGGREYSRNPTLTFNPLRRDNAGEYRCTSIFSSPYLTGSRTVTQTRTVTVTSKSCFNFKLSLFLHDFLTLDQLEVTLSGSSMETTGQTYTFTCSVTRGGTMTPTYRWFRNGSPLSGQTSATLSFSPLRQSDSGVYTCEGTKGLINLTSNRESISVEGMCTS